MILPLHFRTDPDWRKRPRAPGGGRKHNIPKVKRLLLFQLMRDQREAQRQINTILDGIKMAQTQRARADALRKIWRSHGG